MTELEGTHVVVGSMFDLSKPSMTGRVSWTTESVEAKQGLKRAETLER
jgi:hypothetical protein